MADHIGNNGAVYAGANEVGSITSWDWTSTQPNVDTTAMKDTVATFLAGRSTTTGSFTCNWSESDTGQTSVVAGAALTLKLYNDGETTGDLYDEVPVVIDSVAKSASDGAVITKTCSWTGTGALVEDTAVV